MMSHLKQQQDKKNEHWDNVNNLVPRFKNSFAKKNIHAESEIGCYIERTK